MADTKGQAIRPEIFNLRAFQTEERTDEEVLTDEEKTLAHGSRTAFWKILKKHINNVTEELDQMTMESVSSGASLEEIGRNTVVINLTKGVLRRIFNIVEDAKEAEGKHGK